MKSLQNKQTKKPKLLQFNCFSFLKHSERIKRFCDPVLHLPYICSPKYATDYHTFAPIKDLSSTNKTISLS